MKKYTTFFFLFFIAVSFGQRKFAADRYFKELSYVKSAKLYEIVYQKGDSSKLVLNRLADSYYLNNKSIDAEKWFAKLFKLYEKDSLSKENYFKYAQSLKINGKYKESDIWFAKLKKLSEIDSRGWRFSKNSNYLPEYSLDKERFKNIRNVSANTPYSDFGAFMRDSVVLFASTRPKNYKLKDPIYGWNNQPFLDLYQAKETVFSNETGEFSSDISLSKMMKNINTKYHEATAIITKDGKTMYFTRDNYNGRKLRKGKNDIANLKIYKANWIDNQWKKIKELPFNNDNYSTGHPTLSPDEKTLYFVSDMPNGYGKTDLYQVAILENNAFGEPKNLGPQINTEGKEMFPFVSSKNVLYFSSDGHIGLGSLDVFESKIDNNTFQEPKNLETPINSKKDDFALTLSANNNRGYFSSNRDGGKGDDDIYSFLVAPKKKIIPVCNQQVVGQIRDGVTNEILVGSSVSLFDNNNVKIDSLIVGENGYFEFLLPCNQKYRLEGLKRYYKKDVQFVITIPQDGPIRTKRVDLKLNDDFRYSDRLEMIINIKPIYFDFNKSSIRPDAARELNRVIAVMNKYPELIIQSSSHTDSSGKDIYNMALSTRRAISTVNYILSKGIKPNRISGKGFGETQLVNDCSDGVKCSDEENQLNRRTEFVILKDKMKN